MTGLNKVARNLWWTWNQEAQEIFQELSPRGWQNLYHNAVAILHEVSDYELRVRLQDPDFCARVREVLRLFEAYMNEQHTWAHEHAPALRANPVAYFSAEFGFHETLPDRGRRPGHPGGGPCQVRQRPGHRFCGHQPVLPGRLFSAGDRCEQLADGILHAAEPEEPAGRTGAERKGRAAGLPRGHRDEPGGVPGLAGERRPGGGLFAGCEPPGERAAFPRPDPAGLWRRQHDADHAGNAAGHRGRAAAARAGGAAVGLPHERRARGLSDAGADPREDGGGEEPAGGADPDEGGVHLHHAHARGSRP